MTNTRSLRYCRFDCFLDFQPDAYVRSRCLTHRGHRYHRGHKTCPVSSVVSVSSVCQTPGSDVSVWLEVQKAIEATIPKGPGVRHRQVCEFARRRKAIEKLADVDAHALKDFVRTWHQAAL